MGLGIWRRRWASGLENLVYYLYVCSWINFEQLDYVKVTILKWYLSFLALEV